jgi:hypothetical protein
MKVLTDALEEFRDRMDEVFVMDDFTVVLDTNSDPSLSVRVTAKLHPENADEYVLEFE